MNLNQYQFSEQRKYIKLQQKGIKYQRFEFRSYDLAFQVREILYLKVIAFDANKDLNFQQKEVRGFLEEVLHQTQPEVHYMVKNVFRYDYNNNGCVEYDQLVNFCMEQHFGQIAIQRLHKKKLYERGSQRMMSQKQFKQTIKYALSFIDFLPPDNDLKMVFEAVDVDKDGYISYEDYFRFLKEYFGSKSVAAGLVNKSSVIQQLKSSKDIKTDLNIVRKYSKYDQKGNAMPQKPPPSISSIANKQKSIATSNVQNSSVQYSLNINNLDKKQRPVSSPKLQITLLNKSTRRDGKTQITLNQVQSIIADSITKLVYTQLKVALTNYDSNQDCFISTDDILNFMKNTLKYTEHTLNEVYKRNNFTKDKLWSYDEGVKIVMNEHIYRVFRLLDANDGKILAQFEFVQLCQKVCSIVKNIPLIPKFESLYQSRCQKNVPLTMWDAQNLLQLIFASYSLKK